MKKSLLSFLFSLSTLTFFGQVNVYHPFPDSNAVWRGDEYYNPCNCTMTCTASCGASSQYFMQGDTTIGAYSYHKVYSTSVFFFNGNQSAPATSFFGGLRQDTALRKVYCSIPSENIIDTLLYDFALQIGDTLKGYLARPSLWTLTVNTVDSILLGNSYRKRINFGPQLGTSEYKFIEGIGFAAGLFYNGWTMEDGGQLVCFSQEAKALYPDTNCGWYFFGINELKSTDDKLDVYPVPANSILKLKELVSGKIRIFNSLGEVALLDENKGKIEEIDLSKLAPGIYFLELESGKKRRTAKIIKE